MIFFCPKIFEILLSTHLNGVYNIYFLHQNRSSTFREIALFDFFKELIFAGILYHISLSV